MRKAFANETSTNDAVSFERPSLVCNSKISTLQRYTIKSKILGQAGRCKQCRPRLANRKSQKLFPLEKKKVGKHEGVPIHLNGPV